MSMYMEYFLELHPRSKYLFTDDDDDKAHNRLKAKYTNNVRDDVLRKPDFVELAPEAARVSPNG